MTEETLSKVCQATDKYLRIYHVGVSVDKVKIKHAIKDMYIELMSNRHLAKQLCKKDATLFTDFKRKNMHKDIDLQLNVTIIGSHRQFTLHVDQDEYEILGWEELNHEA